MSLEKMLRTKLIDPLVDRIADQVVRAILDRLDRRPASLLEMQHPADPEKGAPKCEDQQVQPIPSQQNQFIEGLTYSKVIGDLPAPQNPPQAPRRRSEVCKQADFSLVLIDIGAPHSGCPNSTPINN